MPAYTSILTQKRGKHYSKKNINCSKKNMIDSAAAMISRTLKQIAAMDLDALRENKMAIPLAVGIFVIFFVLFQSSSSAVTPPKQTSKKTPAKKKKKSLANTKESSSPKKSAYKSINSVLKAASKQLGVKVVEVTAKSAPAIHEALRTKGTLKQLVNGRLRSTFVYDFLSCIAGTYLKGSSKIDGQIPDDEEYDIHNDGANFAWQGLRIFVVQQGSSIKGMCVLHDAYLSSYPGPDAAHHRYDPEVRLSSNGKNVANQIGNAGSLKWTDIPIVCGRGYGRLCLAVALNAAKAKSTSFLVNIAGGESNRKMVKLLEDFGFKTLFMQHPKTGDDWLDEEGVELELMYRNKRLTPDSAATLLLSRPSSSSKSSAKKARSKTPVKKAKKKASPAKKKSPSAKAKKKKSPAKKVRTPSTRRSSRR